MEEGDLSHGRKQSKEKKIPTDYISDSESSEEETNQYLHTSQEERLYHTITGSAQATESSTSAYYGTV